VAGEKDSARSEGKGGKKKASKAFLRSYKLRPRKEGGKKEGGRVQKLCPTQNTHWLGREPEEGAGHLDAPEGREIDQEIASGMGGGDGWKPSRKGGERGRGGSKG